MSFKIVLLFVLFLSGYTFALHKVDNNLLTSLQTNPVSDILISINGGIDGVLNQFCGVSFPNKGARATAIYQALKSHAVTTQGPVLSLLQIFPLIKFETFWITNEVLVLGANLQLINLLIALTSVVGIRKPLTITIPTPEPEPYTPGTPVEWGLMKMDVPGAWNISGNGSGVVVGILDTGVRYTHEAIRSSYRGGDHAWFNPYDTTSQFPTDGHGHGTHVTGTIAGLYGIGVAPGVKWMACKHYKDDGSGTESGNIACGQFMACPTKYNGLSPNCAFIPDIINNSWSWDWPEDDNFKPVIDVWRAIGIIPVFSNNNYGPACRTTTTPGAYDNVISVGATNKTDTIAGFSSRGPSNITDNTKPDISAPGVDTRSADISSDSSYISFSGTSMACPHVTGLISLLLSYNPTLNYCEVKDILQKTVDQNLGFDGEECNGIIDSVFPNNKFGYGRVNALRAIQSLQQGNWTHLPLCDLCST